MEQTVRWDWQCICTFMFLCLDFKLDGGDTEESLLSKANQITDLQDTLIRVLLSAVLCETVSLNICRFKFCILETHTRPIVFKLRSIKFKS